MKIGEEELAGVVLGAGAGPHELFAVGREDGEHVGTGEVGDANRRAEIKRAALDLIVGQPQVVVGAGVGVGMIGAAPDDELLRRMPVRSPVDAGGIRERGLVLTVDAGDIDLQPFGLFAVAAEDDPFAVGRNERTAVVAGGVGELPHVGAVGIHDIDVGVAIAVAAKGDLLAVFRVGSFGVVAGDVGQAAEDVAVEIGLEQVHVGIEIPFVAAT